VLSSNAETECFSVLFCYYLSNLVTVRGGMRFYTFPFFPKNILLMKYEMAKNCSFLIALDLKTQSFLPLRHLL